MRSQFLAPADRSESFAISRRRWLIAGCSLLVPATCGKLLRAVEPETYIDPSENKIRIWDGAKQVVIAYQQGEAKGEPCREMAAAEAELPVHFVWQLPPDWVKTFPTVHFLTSSGRWEVCEGWQDVDTFCDVLADYNPPPRTSRQISPFKRFVQEYYPPYWRWPGRITEHLLDPYGPHRFSEYELRGLKTSEKKRLHAAHHQGVIEPGRRPPSTNELNEILAAAAQPIVMGQ